MHGVEFRTSPEVAGHGPADSLVPYVDGESLVELLRRVEAPAARQDGQAEVAGSYLGLTDRAVRWPSRHYLGEPVLSWFGDGDTVLLGCTCGDWGCWPFTARVVLTPATVTWTGYRNGHRSWDYASLPDLVFAREPYEAAVRATALG